MGTFRNPRSTKTMPAITNTIAISNAITPNAGHSYNDASMSSDASRLAYQRWHLGGITSAIYVSNRDGSGEHRVTPARLLAYAPDWQPEGGRIAFASDLYGDRPFGSIFTVAAEVHSVRP